MIVRRDIFQAISDPTRRKIIFLLASAALTPNALAEYFNSSRQAISKHIQILQECNVVSAELKGREIYYQIKPESFKEIENWLNEFKSIMDNRFKLLDEVLENLKKLKK